MKKVLVILIVLIVGFVLGISYIKFFGTNNEVKPENTEVQVEEQKEETTIENEEQTDIKITSAVNSFTDSSSKPSNSYVNTKISDNYKVVKDTVIYESDEIKDVKINSNIYDSIVNYNYSNITNIENGDDIYYSVNIINGKALVKAFDSTKELTISQIDNVISVYANVNVQGYGSVTYYLLTSNKEVYRYTISATNKSDNEITEFEMSIYKYNVSNVSAIYGVSGHELNGDAGYPTIFIKTNDGNYYTDGVESEYNKLVRIIK